MEDFEINYEIANAKAYLEKGQSPVQIRRILIDNGIEKEMASRISKKVYIRFLKSSARIKIIRGSVWLVAGLLTSIFLFQYADKLSYLVILGSIWGLFQVISGISRIKSATELSDKIFI